MIFYLTFDLSFKNRSLGKVRYGKWYVL